MKVNNKKISVAVKMGCALEEILYSCLLCVISAHRCLLLEVSLCTVRGSLSVNICLVRESAGRQLLSVGSQPMHSCLPCEVILHAMTICWESTVCSCLLGGISLCTAVLCVDSACALLPSAQSQAAHSCLLRGINLCAVVFCGEPVVSQPVYTSLLHGTQPVCSCLLSGINLFPAVSCMEPYSTLLCTSARLQTYKLIPKVRTKTFAGMQLQTFKFGLLHFCNS
jgi:hypothetical protein